MFHVDLRQKALWYSLKTVDMEKACFSDPLFTLCIMRFAEIMITRNQQMDKKQNYILIIILLLLLCNPLIIHSHVRIPCLWGISIDIIFFYTFKKHHLCYIVKLWYCHPCQCMNTWQHTHAGFPCFMRTFHRPVIFIRYKCYILPSLQ